MLYVLHQGGQLLHVGYLLDGPAAWERQLLDGHGGDVRSVGACCPVGA